MSLRTFNLILREITGFVVDVAQRGILEWHTDQEYAHMSYVLGSDGLIYKSKQASGGTGTSQNPTADSSNTYWERAFTSAAAASNVEVEAGAATDKYISPGRLLAGLFKDTVNARWRSTTARFGLSKRASTSDVSARSGANYVASEDLPAVSNPAAASTMVRGTVRYATDDEIDDGAATGAVPNVAGMQRKVNSIGGTSVRLVDGEAITAETLKTFALGNNRSDFVALYHLKNNLLRLLMSYMASSTQSIMTLF